MNATAKQFIIYEKPTDSGRPRSGLQRKEHLSIRMEPRHKDLIIKRFGSIQKWIDFLISKLDDKTA